MRNSRHRWKLPRKDSPGGKAPKSPNGAFSTTPDTRYSTRKLLPRFFLFSARMIDDQADMDLRWKIYAETMGAGVQRKGTQEQKNRLPAAGSNFSSGEERGSSCMKREDRG